MMVFLGILAVIFAIGTITDIREPHGKWFMVCLIIILVLMTVLSKY